MGRARIENGEGQALRHGINMSARGKEESRQAKDNMETNSGDRKITAWLDVMGSSKDSSDGQNKMVLVH